MIKRTKYNELLKWKASIKRRPLLIQGARQVGKTTLVREFGSKNFSKFHYINFELNSRLKEIFEGDLEPKNILKRYEATTQTSVSSEDLIFFDEIQECPNALTSLKYFEELLPQQAVVAAGSLLGVALSGTSFPVGKTEHFWLGPCTFEEFLTSGDSSTLLDAFNEVKNTLTVHPSIHESLNEELRTYSACGGLPAAIQAYRNSETTHPFGVTREAQLELLNDYRSDFSKYSLKENAVHIRAIFENIPIQFAKVLEGSSKKFSFTRVIQGKKGYATLQHPIQWLVNAGLVYRVPIANRAMLPLTSFCEDSVFKLFLFDVGILGAQGGLPIELIQAGNYGLAKGYFAESLVLQALWQQQTGETIATWMEGQSEIEFLTTFGEYLIPIEVKSGTNTRSKSLASYIKRYAPKFAIKLSLEAPHYQTESRTWNLPLYLSWSLRDLQLIRS